jgi:DNA replicative helicase MCM subunit Mcm2 (Cdc46/Mcm family)
VYSVSQAKKIESGQITVTGIISSLSTRYWVISKSEWECSNLNCNQIGSQNYTPPRIIPPRHLDNTAGDIQCPQCKSTAFSVKHELRAAKRIQVIDADNNHNESYDSLEVVLYDESCSHPIAGEVVDITGELRVQRKVESGFNGKKLISVLHSSSLDSKHKEEIIITPEDIEVLHRHKAMCEKAYQHELEAIKHNPDLTEKITPMRYIDRIVAMFAPNVIGHNDKKLGLLRSIVGAVSDHGNDNGRHMG